MTAKAPSMDLPYPAAEGKALGLRQRELAQILRRNEQQISRDENADDLPMDLRLAVAELLERAERGEPLEVVGSTESTQAVFCTPEQLRMSGTGTVYAASIGLSLAGVVTIVQSIRAHFYKSMTAYADNKVWQDVYHVPHGGTLFYT